MGSGAEMISVLVVASAFTVTPLAENAAVLPCGRWCRVRARPCPGRCSRYGRRHPCHCSARRRKRWLQTYSPAGRWHCPSCCPGRRRRPARPSAARGGIAAAAAVALSGQDAAQHAGQMRGLGVAQVDHVQVVRVRLRAVQLADQVARQLGAAGAERTMTLLARGSATTTTRWLGSSLRWASSNSEAMPAMSTAMPCRTLTTSVTSDEDCRCWR